MKKKPFYFEIKTAITQFMAAFNDIFIKRYDKDRNVTATDIPVGFVYGPKQRVIEDILNKSKNLTLPAISVSVSSISRDPERIFNKIEGHFISTSTNEDKARLIPQPVPISLGINLSIICRYQEDIEQIISNIAAYCDPYIVVSWKLPTTENTTYEQEVRSVIEWGGTFNITFPSELAASQVARITADATFTVRTWLFKEINASADLIHKITTTFMPSVLSEECFIFSNSTDPDSYIDAGDSTVKDTVEIDGIPRVKDSNLSVYSMRNNIAKDSITIFGHNFEKITGVYVIPMADVWLPGAPLFAGMLLYDLYANADQNIRTNNPSFTGKKVTNYTIASDNRLEMFLPTAPLHDDDYFDIIVASEGGYTRLSIESRREDISTDFDWQPPYYDTGIKVVI
jgi:hypothetical protein